MFSDLIKLIGMVQALNLSIERLSGKNSNFLGEPHILSTFQLKQVEQMVSYPNG